MNRRECNGCQYRGKTGSGDVTCDFMFLTGVPRGCPAGKGCTRKVTGKKPKRRNVISVRGYSNGEIAGRNR